MFRYFYTIITDFSRLYNNVVPFVFFQVGTISLSSSNYNVEESAGSVIVSVELVGGEVDDVVEVR